MKILVAMDLTEADQKKFTAAAGENTVVFTPRVGPWDTALDAEIIIGNPPRDRLGMWENLKVICLNSAGNDGYDTACAAIPGLTLCNGSGAYGLAMSEHMLCVLMMLMKRLQLYRDVQRSAQWNNLGPIRSISGSRILVLGFGNIGAAFAERAKVLGAYVIGMKRTPADCPACADEMHTSDELDALLPTVDAVCMSLPATGETKNILSRARIGSMKPGSYIVNVGRGSAIDQDALAEALTSGAIGGAALDVTYPEPLPAEHPLWQCENCIITPHISGNYNLAETEHIVIDIALNNMKAYVEGRPLSNVVDLKRGY